MFGYQLVSVATGLGQSCSSQTKDSRQGTPRSDVTRGKESKNKTKSFTSVQYNTECGLPFKNKMYKSVVYLRKLYVMCDLRRGWRHFTHLLFARVARTPLT